MRWQSTRYGYALRLDAGEEIVSSLAAFAAERGIRAGAFSGIGAAGDCELGFFVRGTGAYVRRVFDREYEIGALTGNFSELEGRPFPHCHVVLGDESFAAYTGHLFRATVTVTCEIHVVTDPEVLRRVTRPGLGYHPLEPRQD